MKTVKMPVLDRNAKTITATREFLIRAGQFGSTEFNILLDMQKSNPGYTVQLSTRRLELASSRLQLLNALCHATGDADWPDELKHFDWEYRIRE